MPSGGRPSLTVVTVDYHTEPSLWKMRPRIQRLRDFADAPVEWIIVRNDLNRRALGMDDEWVRTIELPNVGFAAGFNAGARVACGDFLLSLNSDVTFSDEFMREIVEVMTRDVNAGTAALYAPPLVTDGILTYGRQHYTAASLLLSRMPGRRNAHQLSSDNRIDWVLGACFLIRRADFLHMGGFDERFFLYFEDVEFCRRWTSQGRDISSLETSVEHDHRRASRRLSMPLVWHIVSAIRFAMMGGLRRRGPRKNG
jgi:N-acetylglucosaminyl-diphospho-decaprenol L-rhamnosyltransferase